MDNDTLPLPCIFESGEKQRYSEKQTPIPAIVNKSVSYNDRIQKHYHQYDHALYRNRFRIFHGIPFSCCLKFIFCMLRPELYAMLLQAHAFSTKLLPSVLPFAPVAAFHKCDCRSFYKTQFQPATCF